MQFIIHFLSAIIRSDVSSSSNPFTISWPILWAVIAIWLVTMLVLLKRVSFVSRTYLLDFTKLIHCSSSLLFRQENSCAVYVS